MKRAFQAAVVAAALWAIPTFGYSAEYRITGTYFETCACNPGCPCIFLQNASAEHCDATLVWKIDKGTFGGVDLAGRTAVVVLSAPGANMAKSVGKWTGALYIDWDASEKQRKALESIITEKIGKLFAAKLMAKQVPIRVEIQNGAHSVNIPGVVNASIRRMAGPDGKDVIISNAPMSLVPELHLATSEKHVYEDKVLGKPWNMPAGRNGFYGPFDYSGEKATAGEKVRPGAK